MKKNIGLITSNKMFLLLAFFTAVFAYTNNGERYNSIILTVFLLTGLGALYGLFLSIDKKAISINKTYCLFHYFFFSLAPIIQFKNSSTFHFKGYIEDAAYLKSGQVVLISLVTYLWVYKWLYSIKIKYSNPLSSNNNSQSFKTINHKKLIVFSYLLAFISIVFYLYLLKFKWDLLIYRPFSYDLKNNTNLGLVGYSLLLIVRLIPFIVLMNYILLGFKKNKYAFGLLVFVLFSCFPTALSRGILAIIYIPLVVIYMPILSKKNYYIGMYCLGILVVFPLFNMVRDLRTVGLRVSYKLFDTGHFDAFQNFTLLLREKIITNGEQLLTSVLFFVQENTWPNKPPGTGHLMGEKLYFEYLNISMPWIGEGYANFGYFGVFAFIFIIAIVNVFLDRCKLKNKWINFYFYMFLGYEFYLLRGDLWSASKIFVSFTLAIVLVSVTNSLWMNISKGKIKG
ncbi:hypothetical protein FHR24_000760 [Wenyingzhuangia heitensis]|uniref:Oligosaccharide repeat unit polymerase n=1 Tax=Wenyingzhuangia heitensis TaxID=1487859 RepID=A0ABX0UA15_9FLAO|nr:O-antigen polymerase [Wenyingzhuangia heitensis]NIJ44321.1 hypothetical protein [Wenyingzhuangia heitensis]